MPNRDQRPDGVRDPLRRGPATEIATGQGARAPEAQSPKQHTTKQQAKQQSRRGGLCLVVYLHTPGLKPAVRGVVWSFLVGETPWP